MEKILLAMEGHRQNTYAIDFACYLAKLSKSRLTGVFLEGDEDGKGPRPVLHQETEPLTMEEFIRDRPDDPTLKMMKHFREACVCRDVPARVHRDRGIPLADVLLESRFSDLLVVDPETSFKKLEREFPGRFVRDVLLAAECPVVVSPYSFDSLDEVIFAYNATPSSVYAIKQFTYLFPEFRSKKAVVVNVRKSGGEAIEEQFKMKEWFTAHYQDVTFVVLPGEASDELFGYLLERKQAIVVLGAYGRGVLSRFFKPSHAALLLRTINLPIFIAHR